jgi:L-ascorbate metabolism protein UlaG (beta-lactamase superfamily)
LTAVRITFVGHSTVLIELDGVRVLTDPVLRSRVLHLVRRGPAAEPRAIVDVDLILISHMHHDHFDPPSLRGIDRRAELVVPRGAGRSAEKLGFERVTELGKDERLTAGDVEVAATHAEHRPGRLLGKRSAAIGYRLIGSQRVYFAGDTDLFPGMGLIGDNLDVALLPVSGWGPRVGPGHLDPRRAAESLELLRPRVAVPIHWGTLYRIGLRRSHREPLAGPARIFAREAARLAPSVEIRVLEPGETTVVEA